MKLLQLCLCACVLVPTVAFGQEADDEKQTLSKQVQALRQELESKQMELAKILEKKDTKIQEMAVKLDKAATELANAKQKIEASHEAALRQTKLAESAAAKVDLGFWGFGAYEAARKSITQRGAATEVLFQLSADQLQAKAIKDRLSGELKRLQAELAKARSAYGKAHPAVKSLEQRARVLHSYTERSSTAASRAKVKSDDAMKALEKRYERLKQAEKQMGKSEYSDALAKYRALVRADLMRLETQMKMVQQDQKASSKTLQEKRTVEMLEMQERIKRAEQLAMRERYMARIPKRTVSSTEKRLDKLETKVDKIASLLERLVEREFGPQHDEKEDE